MCAYDCICVCLYVCRSILKYHWETGGVSILVHTYHLTACVIVPRVCVEFLSVAACDTVRRCSYRCTEMLTLFTETQCKTIYLSVIGADRPTNAHILVLSTCEDVHIAGCTWGHYFVN